MNMNYLVYGTFLALLGLAGCATKGHHRATVAMKIDGKIAHVGMGSAELSVGDHVVAYREECKRISGKNDATTCKKMEVGHGVVKEILSSDYSLVEFDEAVGFVEGDLVQLHAK